VNDQSEFTVLRAFVDDYRYRERISAKGLSKVPGKRSCAEVNEYSRELEDKPPLQKVA
jgi:hypothetical protein